MYIDCVDYIAAIETVNDYDKGASLESECKEEDKSKYRSLVG